MSNWASFSSSACLKAQPKHCGRAVISRTVLVKCLVLLCLNKSEGGRRTLAELGAAPPGHQARDTVVWPWSWSTGSLLLQGQRVPSPPGFPPLVGHPRSHPRVAWVVNNPSPLPARCCPTLARFRCSQRRDGAPEPEPARQQRWRGAGSEQELRVASLPRYP